MNFVRWNSNHTMDIPGLGLDIHIVNRQRIRGETG